MLLTTVLASVDHVSLASDWTVKFSWRKCDVAATARQYRISRDTVMGRYVWRYAFERCTTPSSMSHNNNRVRVNRHRDERFADVCVLQRYGVGRDHGEQKDGFGLWIACTMIWGCNGVGGHIMVRQNTSTSSWRLSNVRRLDPGMMRCVISSRWRRWKLLLLCCVQYVNVKNW